VSGLQPSVRSRTPLAVPDATARDVTYVCHVRPRLVGLGLLVLVLGACSGQRSADIHGAWLEQEGRALRLMIMTCNATLAVTVTESAERVEILVAARNDTTSDCADILVVELASPLAQRTVTDLHDGQTVEVLPEGSTQEFNDGAPDRNR